MYVYVQISTCKLDPPSCCILFAFLFGGGGGGGGGGGWEYLYSTLRYPFPSQAGANMIVSGSAVVKSPDPKTVIEQLRTSVEKWLKVHAGGNFVS